MRTLLSLLLAIAFLAVSTPAFAAAPKCVDVEKATAKDLMALKGIQDKLAKAIIDFRKKKRTEATKAGKKAWNFKNWATLLTVPGIGPKLCADNVTLVCFTGKVQKTCPKPKK